MTVRVLKEFLYSTDGIRASALPVGWEGDIAADLVDGLVSEGWVELIGAAAADDSADDAKEAPAGRPVLKGKVRPK